MTTLAGRTLLMSGGSRGIGLAIATRAAQDSANIVLLAKTAQPHARLQGTVHTAAAQIDAAGGRALAIVGDVRNDDDVARAGPRQSTGSADSTSSSTTPAPSTCGRPARST